jgi:flavin-dependent dehydrogenase
VDSTLKQDEGNFLFLNAETGEVRFKITPTKERYRLHRLKLLNLLSTGVDIQWGQKVESYDDSSDGVKVHFEDGSLAAGSILIGADGNNSNGMAIFVHYYNPMEGNMKHSTEMPDPR